MAEVSEIGKGPSTAGRKSVPAVSREDRPPPHDPDLEKAALGAMLLEPSPAVDIAAGKLDDSAFYVPAHRRIFENIRAIHSGKTQKVDILSVAAGLRADGVLEQIGGENYLLDLQNMVPTTANMESWCEMLRDLRSLRKMISVCAKTMDDCYGARHEDIPAMLDRVEDDILNIRGDESESSAEKVGKFVVKAVKQLEDLHNRDEAATGISTGYPDLDNIVMGLKPGEMFVLAARPSIGKTSLALNMAVNVADMERKNRPVAFFSLEMTAEELTRRLICGLAEISAKDFFDRRFSESEFGRIWHRISQAADRLRKSNLFIDPTPALSVNELRAKAKRLKMQHKIEAIFIDYLQLMRAEVGNNENRQVEVAKISVGIKALAKDLSVPVVVLAQLNRQAETQDKPKLSHLRESGAIEQDADVVAFLHRDRDPQKDMEKAAGNQALEAELIVEKNRNGSTGNIKLWFFPKITTFKQASRYQDEHVPER